MERFSEREYLLHTGRLGACRGSEPSFASSYYDGPFNLNYTAALKVIAYSADFSE